MVSVFYVLQNSDFRYFFVNLFSNLLNNNIDNYLCLYSVDLIKGYLKGRYGAIPFFKTMEVLV
jgi:hypothetical protein